MPSITNPTPVTSGVFSGMWVTRLSIRFPGTPSLLNALQATLSPFDGTNLLALGGKNLRKPLPTTDEATNAVLDALITEVKRQADTEADPVLIQVLALDPTRPVFAQITFTSGPPLRIPDCFALAATDPVFAPVFIATLAEIARLAGLPFTP